MKSGSPGGRRKYRKGTSASQEQRRGPRVCRALPRFPTHAGTINRRTAKLPSKQNSSVLPGPSTPFWPSGHFHPGAGKKKIGGNAHRGPLLWKAAPDLLRLVTGSKCKPPIHPGLGFEGKAQTRPRGQKSTAKQPLSKHASSKPHDPSSPR